MEDWGDELTPGMRCIKYLMIAFNAIFVMTGVLTIAVGTTIHSIYYNFDEFLETSFFSPATLLIVIGSFIFVIALFGCIGAAKESTCMINTFALLLGLIFILEISAGIAAFALQGTIAYTIRFNMRVAMDRYEVDENARDTVDLINSGLSCCGIDSPEDWNGTLLTNDSSFIIEEGDIVVPDSCCGSMHTETGTNATICDEAYRDGCLPSLTFVVAQSAILLGGAALAVSIIQVIGIYFSYSLAKSIRRAKNERIHRQYQIQEQLRNSFSLPTPTIEKVHYPEPLNPSNLQS